MPLSAQQPARPAARGVQDRLHRAAIEGPLSVIGGLIGQGVSQHLLEPLGSAALAKLAPQSYQARQIREALERSGKTPAEVEQAMREAAAEGQPEFKWAEAIGEGGRTLLNAITRQPSRAASEAAEQARMRAAGQAQRVEELLREGLNSKKTGAQLYEELEQLKKTEAQANYDPIRNDPANAAVWGPEFDELLKRPSIQAAIKDAAGTALERGLKGPRNPFVQDKDGKWILPQHEMPDFHFLENLKVAMDQKNRTDLGGVKDKYVARTVDDLTNAIDTYVPDYAAARLPYKQASDAQRAIDEGKAAAQSGLSQDVLRQIQALPPHKRDGFIAGYTDELAEKAQRKGEGADATRFLRVGKYKDELPALATDPDALARKLARETETSITKERITGGSSTVPNLMDRATLGTAGALSLAEQLLGGGGMAGAGAGLVFGGLRHGIEKLRQASPALEANLPLARGLLGNITDTPDFLRNINITGRPGSISVPLLQALNLQAVGAGAEKAQEKVGKAIEWAGSGPIGKFIEDFMKDKKERR